MKREFAVLSIGVVILVSTGALLAEDRLVPSVYPTIQAGIDAAGPGDTVVIAPEVYTGAGNKNVDFGGKAITVRSTNPDDPAVVAATVVDCEQSGRGFHFHSGEGPSSVAAGLTITNGSADKGAGIFCEGGSPTIAKCVLSGNHASWYGGGMEIDGGSPTVTNCIFRSNDADMYGGGIDNYNSSPTVRSCIFAGNNADYGGAIENTDSSPMIIGCTFSGNLANHGGGIDCYGSSNPTVSNCILWGDSAGEGPEIRGSASVTYSDVQGGYSGTGNIDADPFFADAAGGDYHLLEGSPCINAGDPGFSPGVGETDIDGEARVMGGRVEMGADEHPIDKPIFEIWAGEFEFSAGLGGPNPAPQVLSIRNVGAGILNWDITEDCSWVEVLPGSGQSSGEVNEVTLSVDIGGLAAGGYYCELTISDPCALNSPQVVDVSLIVSRPIIELSSQAFEFSGYLGGPDLEDQILGIRNSGLGTLNWQVSEDCGWLSAEPNSGSSTGESDDVTLSIDISGLGAGSYYCALVVSDVNAENSPQTVVVNLTVVGPLIELSSDEFGFWAEPEGPNPGAQILTVRNGGGGTLNWHISEDCNWLSAEPNSGSSTGESDDVTLSVDISGLAEGGYNCELTISDANAENNPQIVEVSLSVGVGELLVPSEYLTIQAAIDAAGPGDMVVVAEGIHTGSGNRDLDFKGKAITVRSIDPEDPCVVAATTIDCNGGKDDPHRGFYFHSGEGPDSVVSGLTITNGYVYDANGGGIYCNGSSPRIENCVIANNTAHGRDATCCNQWDPDCDNLRHGGNCGGGGIYCTANSDPLILRCTITNNEVTGGVGNSGPYCQDLVWPGNGGKGYGGGVHCETGSSPSIIECTISNNKAFGGESGDWYPERRSADAYGGGISCISGSSATIANSEIRSNEAHGGHGVPGDMSSCGGNAYGGGIYCDSNSSATIRGSAIELNAASGGAGADAWTFWMPGADAGHGSGGGVYSDSPAGLMLENCIISGNTASGGAGGYGGTSGGPWCARGGDGFGGGLWLTNGPAGVVRNCIIVGNVARGGDGGDGSFDSGYPPGVGGDAWGSGIYWISTYGSSISNCTVADNAVWVGNGGRTFTGTEWVKGAPDGNDYGAGAYFDYVAMTNSIVWGNDSNDANAVDGNGFAVNYSCVEQVMGGPGNIFADPCFVSGPQGDYYLSQTVAGQAGNSPCVDGGSDLAAGLGMGIYSTRTDQVRDKGVVDMGYHYSTPCSPDFNGDWQVDLKDFAILAGQWLDAPGQPSADIAPDGGDNTVDGLDLEVLVENWLAGL